MTKPITYSDAGVDIDAATLATNRIKELARRTFNDRTLSEILNSATRPRSVGSIQRRLLFLLRGHLETREEIFWMDRDIRM